MEKFMVTTEDNPFNPFTQFDEWHFFDISNGYNTCERLARIVKPSFQLPDEANDSEIEFACDQLVFEGAFNKQGKFVKYIKLKNVEKNQ